MNDPHHAPDRRNTPAENRHLDRVLDVLVWAAFLVAMWHLLGFTLRAFAPLFR